MMRDHVDQNLRCGADRLPLLLGLIDERLGFSIQALRLFDHRLCPIEKIDQRLGRRQRCLDLPELCIAETGNVADQINEPVLQHGSTLYPHTDRNSMRRGASLCAKSRHWSRQPAHDLRHLFDGAFGRPPVGSVRARVALRPTRPFACAFSARAIASSTSFSAPLASSHLTMVTHLPFSRSL